MNDILERYQGYISQIDTVEPAEAVKELGKLQREVVRILARNVVCEFVVINARLKTICKLKRDGVWVDLRYERDRAIGDFKRFLSTLTESCFEPVL